MTKKLKFLPKTSLVNSFKSNVLNSGFLFSNLPNTFEILRKDLWSIEFPQSFGIPETLQVSASRPKINNPRKEIQYKNLTTYYKGKTDAEEITITFRDAIGPSIFQKLLQWQRMHTDFATGKGGYAATYKQTLVLNMEDPTGAVVQKFTLYGCFITSLDGGDLDMTNDEVATVSIVVSFDSYSQDFS